jgi:hypothetical protein
MLGYDLVISVLGIRNLASGIVVTTERPPGYPERRRFPQPKGGAQQLQTNARALPSLDCFVAMR